MAESALKIKFPRTSHLYLTGAGCSTEDDLEASQTDASPFYDMLSDYANMAGHKLVVEEKIDGANLGISLDTDGCFVFQNRGKLITSKSASQWEKLDSWLAGRDASLRSVLMDEDDSPRYIIFGEWMAFKHSIHYDQLPSWFIGFDIFDLKSGVFLPVNKRDEMLVRAELPIINRFLETVPSKKKAGPKIDTVASGKAVIKRLLQTQTPYSSRATVVEGCYLRIESETALVARCKVVNAGFLNGIEAAGHWSTKVATPNNIRPDVWG